MDEDKKFLCPTCDHASDDWCNKRTGIFEAQTECDDYTNKEVRANKKQKELVEKHGMLGMLMNPYEPFEVRIDWDYEEQRLLGELEEVRRCKAEAHLTLEDRYNIAIERLIKASEGMFDDKKEEHVEISTDGKES